MILHIVCYSLYAVAEIWVMISVSLYTVTFFKNSLEITISYYLVEASLFASGLVLLYILNSLVTSSVKATEEEYSDEQLSVCAS